MSLRSEPFFVLLVLVAGFVIWSLALIVVYALHGMGCAYGLGEPLGGKAALAVALLFHLGLNAALLVFAWRRFGFTAAEPPEPRSFLKGASVALAFAALVATTWTGLPVLFLTACR